MTNTTNMTNASFFIRPFAFAIVLMLTLISAQVMAATCVDDTGCSVDEHCEIYETAIACAPAPDGETVDCPEPESSGECVADPITCATDEDCPGLLSCVEFGNDVSCAQSPGGEVVCDEPAGTPESFCIFVPPACTDSTECPENFECVMNNIGIGCDVAEPACPEGESCPEPMPVDCGEPIEVSTEGYCAPQEIRCATADDCPTDWSCEEIGGSSCGSTGTSTDPDDGLGMPPEEECVDETFSACMPPGFEYGVMGGDDGVAGEQESATTDPNSTTEEQDTTAAEADIADDEGMCSVGQVNRSPAQAPIGALALLMGLFFAVRTRRAKREDV